MTELKSTRRPVLRGAMFLFGVGQIALWLIAMATGVTHWFAWIQLVGGALGTYAGIVMPDLERGVPAASGYAFSLGMIALFIIGLAYGIRGWEVWCTFVLSVLLLGGAVYRTPQAVRRVVTPT